MQSCSLIFEPIGAVVVEFPIQNSWKADFVEVRIGVLAGCSAGRCQTTSKISLLQSYKLVQHNDLYR